MRNRLSIWIFLMLSAITYAQNLVVTAELSSENPYVNEEFQVHYKLRINGNGSVQHSGVTVNKSSKEPFELVNEGTPQQNFFSFGGSAVAEYILVYKVGKTGTFELPEFSFELNNKKFKAKPKKVRITKGLDYSNRHETRDYFIDLKFSKTSTFKGAPIVCSVLLFTKTRIADVQFEKREFNDFKVTPIEGTAEARNINVGGTTYVMNEIAVFSLKPRVAGKLTIDPVEVKVKAMVVQNRRRSYVWDVIKSIPYTIDVKDLPKPEPAGFNFAIGDFELISEIDKKNLAVNEAATWKITLKGTGNWSMMDGPEFEFENDLEVFDPKKSESLSTDRNGTHGYKKYEYVLVPRAGGEYILPSYKLVYFDLSERKYKTMETPEYVLNVEGESEGNGAVRVNHGGQRGIEVLSNDIRYIRTENNLEAEEVSESSFMTWLLAGLMQLMVIVLLVWNKLFSSKSGVEKAKSKKEITKAITAIKKSKALLGKDEKEFYQVLYSSFVKYLSLKLGIPLSSFSKESLSEKLSTTQIDPEEIRKLTKILEDCEMVQYAPLSETPDSIYNQAINSINHLESSLG